jgi:PAS domain S-box-containing protein
MDTNSFFEDYYNNAEVNSIIILNEEGTILDVNHAFSHNFGYAKEEIKGKHLSMLFTRPDLEKNKPQIELKTVLATGQAHDENYIVDKQGNEIWCTGESMLVRTKEGEKFIVKDIINLQAKKQLQLFLKETDELLHRIFDSSKDIPMMIMDGSMKVQKVNSAFLELFEMDQFPITGSRLSDLNNSFWNSENLRIDVRKILVDNKPLSKKKYFLETRSGRQKQIIIDSKIVDQHLTREKEIFIIVEDVTPATAH